MEVAVQLGGRDDRFSNLKWRLMAWYKIISASPSSQHFSTLRKVHICWHRLALWRLKLFTGTGEPLLFVSQMRGRHAERLSGRVQLFFPLRQIPLQKHETAQTHFEGVRLCLNAGRDGPWPHESWLHSSLPKARWWFSCSWWPTTTFVVYCWDLKIKWC